MRLLVIFLTVSLSQPAYTDQDGYQGKVYSDHSAQAVGKLNKAAETLQDPTLLLEKFKRTFNRSLVNANPQRMPARNNNDIKDPTQINGSFSEALRRLSSKRKGNESTKIKLPEIILAAKTFSENGKNSSALLSINEKLYFVKPGGSFSFMHDNEIYEIAVESIDIHAVRIRLSPLNETLILR